MTMARGVRWWLALISWVAGQQIFAGELPRPAALEPAVRFWIQVYTAVDSRQGYLHDERHPEVIYETLRFSPSASPSEQQRQVEEARAAVRRALLALAEGKRQGLDERQRRVLAAWGKRADTATLRAAADRVRFQRGLADRFREGYVRSWQWRPHIRRVLARHRLPEELEVLPHVESSFNPRAYSRAAAAGMWQFMPGTARHFMRVDELVDERLDPWVSSEAAARLLERNYRVLGTWPLAITAYNYGAGGMARAVEAVGSKDIAAIVERYQGPNFGFASRNFYACFLAALEVDRKAEHFFGPLPRSQPPELQEVRLEHYVPIQSLAARLGVSLDELREHNPALREPIWRGDKYVPRGYRLRVPQGRGVLEEALASLGSGERFDRQKPDRLHRVRPGESLSVIAARHGTTVETLMALNGLRSHLIRAGDTLRLPQGRRTASPAPAVKSPARAGEYVVAAGDSLWSIARRFDLRPKALAALNGIDPQNPLIRPGQRLRLGPAAGPREYRVQPGDSLWSIARRFAVSEEDLVRWNGLADPHRLRAGQVLRLAAR
ncbi:MAG: hypothetical protein KatS3mg124_1150 [Porticoccaceae bacterium]|nr:MAG: hypothetical protein KatS3mg124_1150 [Porticoccaceae bacterium]